MVIAHDNLINHCSSSFGLLTLTELDDLFSTLRAACLAAEAGRTVGRTAVKEENEEDNAAVSTETAAAMKVLLHIEQNESTCFNIR